MPAKGDHTRQQILCKSKQLFSLQGYATVTMKDICEACQLSRGGLYRYFGSTKEIFLEILDQDRDEKEDILQVSMGNNYPADRLFVDFLEDRKHTKMLGADRGLSFAIHEFSHTEPGQRDHLIKRYQDAAQGLTSLLRYGQRQGVFQEFDPSAMAAHVLLLLDSLEISADMLQISSAGIEKQFQIIYQLIRKIPSGPADHSPAQR